MAQSLIAKPVPTLAASALVISSYMPRWSSGPPTHRALEAAIEPQAPDLRTYGAFGLRIRSAIDLPELPDLEDDGSAVDLMIAWGRVESRLQGGVDVDAYMQVARDRFLLSVPAARYEVRNGRLILIDPRPGVSNRDVRLYLLGAVMTAVCHQRSLTPLHATAIEVDAGAIAFAGPSGAGKSTLAAQFQGRGVTVLADDLCVVRFDSAGRPWALPGLARIKLWGDSLAMVGLAGAPLPRIADDIGKFSLAVPSVATCHPRPFDRIYILRPDASERVEIHPVAGPEAVGALVGNIHRWPLAVAMGRATGCFDACHALATQCKVFEIRFSHAASAPLDVLQAVERHWRG